MWSENMVHLSEYMATYYLHNAMGVPHNGIVVEILCRIKPEMELLFFISYSLTEHIGMEGVGVSRRVSQKLYVDLIMSAPLRL